MSCKVEAAYAPEISGVRIKGRDESEFRISHTSDVLIFNDRIEIGISSQLHLILIEGSSDREGGVGPIQLRSIGGGKGSVERREQCWNRGWIGSQNRAD